ncbi:hypothetical protein HDU96_005563 [Phlyctochytrium bullatum]|nr:hypothetical protein HDU96_005563 [Phlyctochytrium bullatum]
MGLASKLKAAQANSNPQATPPMASVPFQPPPPTAPFAQHPLPPISHQSLPRAVSTSATMPTTSGPPPPYAGGNSGVAAQPIPRNSTVSGAPGAQNPNFEIVLRHLRRIVGENNLQCLYPDQLLFEMAQRLAGKDFGRLSSTFNIPREIVGGLLFWEAFDLCSLALYDIVFFCDDSGSMRFEEGGSRVDDLQLIIGRIAEFACSFDDDGISVRFMNSPVVGDRLRTPDDIQSLIARVNFSGLTPLGTQLERKVLNPFVLDPASQRQLRKPVLVIVVTDGEPVGEPRDTIKRVVLNTHARLRAMGLPNETVAFAFAQCGTDRGAQEFLAELDRDPQIGGQIDCTSYYELEEAEMAAKGVTLTPEVFMVKLCVGAIDKSYDEQDE